MEFPLACSSNSISGFGSQRREGSKVGRALVIFSGGQDSTTCLYWALRTFGDGNVFACTFDYGQRHRIEIEAARKIARSANVPLTLLPIDTFRHLQQNALTGTGAFDDSINPESHLPKTFVPGRNIIFLTLAAAFAYDHQIANLVTGVAQTDYSGYPDCRQETIQSLQQTLHLAMESRFEIHTPLMNLSKAETVMLAQKLGAMEALAWSHTCYQGLRPPCGQCSACRLRAKGFEEAGIPEPLCRIGDMH
ncbi:MAG: 7-cyano-7-deazaguanine synthase QueC [Okeania sp. SIO1H5]|uniref:7-cyano-7-deazaguanine synthase QueC n=1 Tax=Okeania sp. SIO1H5 TaxID=2607777 RepID=UPI0013B7AD6E|nr:7-cyano-7-deazaguanine synthase QueC [Okeania sp. SIO1H5]NET23776.1 7-cyano-7-deazaguanine synthase QueC [Okeania sp. SIO1H5]